jgi:hypothetical protein
MRRKIPTWMWHSLQFFFAGPLQILLLFVAQKMIAFLIDFVQKLVDALLCKVTGFLEGLLLPLLVKHLLFGVIAGFLGVGFRLK